MAGAIASSTVSPKASALGPSSPTDAPGRMAAAVEGIIHTSHDFESVDLPAPFWPTTPIFALGKKHRSTPSKMVRCASGVFLVRPARVNMYWRVAASKRSS